MAQQQPPTREPKLVPVEGDPFKKNGVTLTPVEGDPFASAPSAPSVSEEGGMSPSGVAGRKYELGPLGMEQLGGAGQRIASLDPSSVSLAPKEATITERETIALPEGPVKEAAAEVVRRSDSERYRNVFGSMDMSQVEKAGAGLEKSATALQGQAKRLKWDIEQFNNDMAKLDALRSQAEASNDPYDIDIYNQEREGLMAASEQLKKRTGALEDLERSLMKDANMIHKREYDILKDKGSLGGATMITLGEGIGGMGAGAAGLELTAAAYAPRILDRVLEIALTGPAYIAGGQGEEGLAAVKKMEDLFQPEDPSVKARRWKNGIDALRTAPVQAMRDVGGRYAPMRLETTPEYYEDMQQSFLGKAYLGLVGSLPAMATPGMVGIALQTSDAAAKELEDPRFDDIPEGEKMAVQLFLAAQGMALERFGFRNLATNNAVSKRILASAISKLPKGASAGQIQRVMDAETRNWATNFSVKMLGGALSEAETGGAQALSEDLTRQIYDGLKGRDLLAGRWEDGKFYPTTAGDMVNNALEGAALEAAGAGMLAAPFAVRSAIGTRANIDKMDAMRFMMLDGLLRDPGYEKMFSDHMEAMVKAGKISQAEVDKAMDDLGYAKKIFEQVPEDLDIEKKKKAVDLIRQREELSRRDKNLVGHKVAAINDELKKLAGVPVEGEAAQAKEPKKATEPEPLKTEEAPPPPPKITPEEQMDLDLEGVDAVVDEEVGEMTGGGVMEQRVLRAEEDDPIGFNYTTDQVARERFDIPSLTKIGSGSDRDVYDLGDGRVLKVAKTARGLEQNIYEGEIGEIMPDAHEKGMNYVVTDKVDPAKASDVITYESYEGGEGTTTIGQMLKDLSRFSQRDADNHTAEFQDAMNKYGLNWAMNYNLIWNDFVAKRNWGVKDGHAYHLDGGTFGGVRMLDDYRGKKNLDDADFRDIYNRSRQAKKQFADSDRATMYQKGADQAFNGAEKPSTSRKNIANVISALRKVAPGLKVIVHKTPEGFAKASADAGGRGLSSDAAFWDPKTNEIHINEKEAGDNTLFHEAAHPVLVAALKENPDLLLSFYSELADDPAFARYIAFGEGYADKGDLVVAAEAIVEFMADVAAGKVPVSTKPDSLWQKFKRFISDLLNKLGFDVRSIDLSKPKNVREFAGRFAEAMRTGIKIGGLPQVSRSMGATMQQDVDAMVDGWYSRLDQAVVAKGNTQSGADWLKWAEARAKEGLLSMEEVKWTGLADFLQGKAKVTPQQVRDFLKENRVKVEVVERGDNEYLYDNLYDVEYSEDDVVGTEEDDDSTALRVVFRDGTSQIVDYIPDAEHAEEKTKRDRAWDEMQRIRLEYDALRGGMSTAEWNEANPDKAAALKEEFEKHRSIVSLFENPPVRVAVGKEAAIREAVDKANEARVPVAGGDAKFSEYQLPGGPLSRDTEILTDGGWSRIDAVQIGQRVLTRKDEDGALEWQPVLAKPSVFAKELYHFKNQSIDMMVTANHRMVVKRRRRSSGKIIRMTAKKLWESSEMLVPLTGTWSGGSSEQIFGLDAGDVAEFMGWYIAEGSYKHQNGHKHTLQIAQCDKANPEKCERLRLLMERLGLSFKYYKGAFGVRTRQMNTGLKDLCHQQPTSGGKYIPSIFFSCSKPVIDRLLDGLILGDGSVRRPSRGRKTQTMYFTKSKRLAGDVQALVVLAGRRASVRQRPTGLYAVCIAHKEWCGVDDAKHAIVPYNDRAFCVTVENHAIYVRRNGIAAFTGNSNYREVLVTLPKKRTRKEAVVRKTGDGPYPWQVFAGDATDGNHASSHRTMEEAMEAAARADFATTEKEKFRSSHFPDVVNPLLHLRLNDRTGPNGEKILFIEEMQSDWSQTGRKKGFAKENLSDEAVWKAANDKGYKTLRMTDMRGNEAYWVVVDKNGDEAANGNTEAEAIGAFVSFERGNEPMAPPRAGIAGVTPAPFVTSTDAWVELGLKQAIRMAVDGGYDHIAWTTGEQQNERYDLSKQVKEIRYNPKTKELKAWQKGTSAGYPDIRETVPPEKLQDFIGKEGAERLLAQPIDERLEEHILSGDDLRFGGSGMKGFYDKILPTVAKKVSKKLGGDGVVGDIQLGEPVWALKNKSTGKTIMKYRGVDPMRSANMSEYKAGLADGRFTLEQEPRENSPDNIGIQQSIAITPEMRQRVSGGVPLMQRPASITPDAYKAALQAVKDASKAGASSAEALDAGAATFSDPAQQEDFRKAIIAKARQMAAQRAGKGANVTAQSQGSAVSNEFKEVRDRILSDAKAFKAGAKAGIKEEVELRKEFAQTLRERLKGLGAKVGPQQVAAMVSRATKTSPRSARQVNALLKYMDKVMANAEYAQKEQDARKLRKGISRMARVKAKHKRDAMLNSVASRFAKLNIAHIEDIDQYLSIAQRLSDALSGPRVKVQDDVVTAKNVDYNITNREVSDYIDMQMEAEKDAEEQEIMMAFEEMRSSLGLEGASLSMAEIKAIMAAMEGDDASMEKDRAIAEEKKKMMRTMASLKVEDLKQAVKDGTVQLDDEKQKMVDDLSAIDTSRLSRADAARLITAVDNVIVNDRWGGVRDLGATGRKDRFFAQVETELPGGAGKPGTESAWFNITDTVATMSEKIAKGVKAAAWLRRAMGLDGAMNAIASAWRITDGHRNERSKLAKSLKYKDSKLNRFRMGVYAYMIQHRGGTAEDMASSFERRKKNLLESLENIKKTTAYTNSAEDADLYERAVNEVLGDATDISGLKLADNMKKLVEHEVNFFRGEMEEMTQRGAEFDHNKLLQLWENYTPQSQTAVGASGHVDEDRKRLDRMMTGKKGVDADPASAKMERTETLRPGHAIDLDFFSVVDRSLFESAADNLGARHLATLREVLTDPRMVDLVGSDTQKLLVERVKSIIGLEGTKMDNMDRLGSEMYHKLARRFAGIALKGVFQLPKQMSVGVSTAVALGSDFDLFGSSYGDAVKSMGDTNSWQYQLLKDQQIHERGKTIAGLEKLGATVTKDPILRGDEHISASMMKKFASKWGITMDKLEVPLALGDVVSARAAFFAFYKQKLREKGVDLRSGEWKTVLDEEAASYANQMVERQQNANTSQAMAEVYKGRGGRKILVDLLFAFSSFAMNQRKRMARDLAIIRNGAPEDKRYAALDLTVAIPLELTAYSSMAYGVAWLGREVIGKIMAEIILGVDDDEEDKDKKSKRRSAKEEIALKVIWDYLFTGVPDIIGNEVKKPLNELGRSLDGKDLYYVRKNGVELGVFGAGMDDLINLYDGAYNILVDQEPVVKWRGQTIPTEPKPLSPEARRAAAALAAFSFLSLAGLSDQTFTRPFAREARKIMDEEKARTHGRKGVEITVDRPAGSRKTNE